MAKKMVVSSSSRLLKSDIIGSAIRAKVLERSSNPRRLSAEIGYAYDHVRKVYNGSEFPGDKLLKTICDHLGLDYESLKTAKTAEKAINSGAIEALTDEDVLLSKMKPYWTQLSKDQKNKIYDQVVVMAEAQMKRTANGL